MNYKVSKELEKAIGVLFDSPEMGYNLLGIKDGIFPDDWYQKVSSRMLYDMKQARLSPF